MIHQTQRARPTLMALSVIALAVTSSATAEEPYAFNPPVFDIEASPDGSILVAENTTVKEIRNGEVLQVTEVPLLPGTSINGLVSMGRGNFFATNSTIDLAIGAGVWHASHGRIRLVGDIETFETEFDPDAFAGPQWKDQDCEEDPSQGFSAGPQSNPYHLTKLSGGTVLVGDAAGNTLLSVRTNREVDWVALFTPPVDGNGDWRVLFPLDADTDCYVQPVPTSVAVGPGGAYYVGELTGAPAVPGWSRVWRIAPGANNVVCPSAQCQEVISGLTSVIDVTFGPDGFLYVLEWDVNGWLAALIGNPGGGALKKCDVATGACAVVEASLLFPGAITFDKTGKLWLLESNIVAPMVRSVDLP